MAHPYPPPPAHAGHAAVPVHCIPASSADIYTHLYLDAHLFASSHPPNPHSHAAVDPTFHVHTHTHTDTNTHTHTEHLLDADDDAAIVSFSTPVAWVHLAHYPSPSFFLSTPKPQTCLPTPTPSTQSSPAVFAMTALPGYEDFSLFGDEPLLPQASTGNTSEPVTTAQQPPPMPASSSTYSASSSVVHFPPSSSSATHPLTSSSVAPATSTAGAIGSVNFLPEWHPTSLLSPSFTPATVFDSPDMGYDASALFSPALLDSAASPYMADAASPLLGEDAAASFASALPHAAAQLFPDLANPPPPPPATSSAVPSPPPPTSHPPPTSTADQIHQHQIQAWAQQQAAHAQAALRQQQAHQQQYAAAAAAAAAARMQGMVAVPGMHSPAIAQWYSPAAVAYAAFPTSATSHQPIGQAPMVRSAVPQSAMASPYLAMQSSFGGGTGSPLTGGSGLIAAHPQPLPPPQRAMSSAQISVQYQQQQQKQQQQQTQRPAAAPAPSKQQAAAPAPVSTSTSAAPVTKPAPSSATSFAPSSTVGKSTRSKASPNVPRRKRPAPDYDGTATTAAVAAALAAQAQAQADAAAAARAAATSQASNAPANAALAPGTAPKVNGLASPPRSSNAHLAPPQQPPADARAHSVSPMMMDSSQHSPMTAASQSLTPDPMHTLAGPTRSSTTTTYRATSSVSDIAHATSPPLTAHSDMSGGATSTSNTNNNSLAANVDALPSLDPVARKRAKNTDAARRSRLKKMQRMETLEERVHQLEDENKALTLQLAVCENDKKNWEAKEDELKARIAYLEDKLFAGMATATAAARRDRDGPAATAAAAGVRD